MDTSIIIYIMLILMGMGIGWLFAIYQQTHYKAEQIEKREGMVAELSAAKQQIELSKHFRNKCELLNGELRNLQNIKTSLEADLREANTRLESVQLYTEDKIRQTIHNQKYLNEQFENLANRIFEQNNRKIEKQNLHSLNNLLTPLREQIDGFRRQIQDSFDQETREHFSLSHEIRNIQKINTEIIQEAINLTRALKGNNKIQGNWGEVILARVLETSGLREGYEYEMQVIVETDICSRMQPDVIVRLPQGKDVLIDAKMALVAYERYFNAEDDCSRELALQEHITSIKNHIRQLGRKDYQQLPKLKTLDYILMFIPIEPAFLLAIDKKPELITEALHNNIMLVSPTTLLVALRTITNLWKYERQNRNTQQIAERASKLYDKLRLFIDDMSSVGQNLNRAQDSYCQAMKKLTSGRGNLIAQAETFHSLGVGIKRKINPELTEQAINQDKEYHVNNN